MLVDDNLMFEGDIVMIRVLRDRPLSRRHVLRQRSWRALILDMHVEAEDSACHELQQGLGFQRRFRKVHSRDTVADRDVEN